MIQTASTQIDRRQQRRSLPKLAAQHQDWFTPRKDHYTANIKKPCRILFAEILAETSLR